jgi:hypothetical protein
MSTRAVKSPVPMLAVFLAVGLVLPACTDRRLHITSDPPGALVWVNDVQLGRTPVEAEFTFYGVYDVRVELEGHEPLWTEQRARAPWYEYPPIDLIAAAMPWPVRTRIDWHFVLEPKPETEESEADILDRARGLREQLGPPAP